MSDYRDILLKALKEGKTMDSCGLDELYYDFGLYTDLCGMSVEDAIKSVTQCCCGGGGSDTGGTKTNNPIIISAEQNTEGKYAVKVKAAYPATAPVVITFTIDGQNATATIPVGSSEAFVEGIVLDSQYATIGKINIATSDEVYKYTATNQISEGLFILTYKIDGKIVHELRIKVGSKIEKFVPEEKTGYLFKGWVPPEPETMPDKDTTLEGTYEAIPYYIVFKDITTGDVRIECFYGQEINKPAASEKKGHDFQGWFMADGKEVPSVLDFIPDGDVEATPKYEPKTYTLTYQTFDGETWKTASVKYDTVIVYEADGPVRTGYDFTGWDNKPENDRMPDSDVILKALYEIHKWNLIYTLADDENPDFSGITFENVEYNSDITEKTTAFAEEHKTDAGKYEFSWDGTEHETTNMPDSNLTIKAIRRVVSHTLKFVDAEGNVYSSITQDYGTDINLTIEPTKEGYTFTGWDKGEIPATMPAEDMTFVSQFEIRQFNVTINDEEGTLLKTVSVDYNTEIATIEAPTKEGYTFVEYVSDEGYTNVPDKDITIVAKYNINVHKITYYVDNEKVHEQNYNYHAAIDEYAYTKEGYTISAWVGLPEDMLMPDEDLEIHATSTVIEYNVTFNVDGVEYETKKVAYGAAITLPTTDPTKTGYTFKQWVGIPETMPANDVTIEAEFAINSYELKFMNGDVAITAFTVEYNAALADYAAQAIGMVESREGYTFSWDSAVPTTMPAENIVITGSYKEKTANLAYYGILKTGVTINEASLKTLESSPETEFEGEGKTLPYIIPANKEEYDTVYKEYYDKRYELRELLDYDEITQEEYDEQMKPYEEKWAKYQSDNMYKLFFVATKGTTLTFIGGSGDDTHKWKKQVENTTIDGIIYDIYILESSGFYAQNIPIPVKHKVIKEI